MKGWGQVLQRLTGNEPLRDLPDAELLRRYLSQGCAEAFACLVRRHGSLVLRICQRELPQECDAEDAFQATFLTLAQKASRIRQVESVAPWLAGVARRLARRLGLQLRQQHQRLRHLALEQSRMTPSVVAPWWNEERHFLPQEYQTVIDLCLIQGYTRAEAARQLGQSPAAVHGLLYRARMKLKKQLVQRGAATGTAFVATQASAATVDRLAPLVAASAVQLLQQGASSLSPTLAALLARSATPWVVPVAALSCLVLGGLTWWGMAVAQPATIRNSLVESNPLVSLPLRTVVAPPVTEARPSQTGTPQQVSQQPSQAPLPQQERQGNDGPAHSAALPVPPADRVPTHGEITTLAKKLPTTSGLLNEGMLPLLPHVVTQKAGEVPFLLSIITSEQEYRDCTAKAPPVKIPNNVQVANDPAWDGGLYQVDWQREVLVVVVMRQRANSATLTSFEENWIPPDAQGVGHLLLHYARPDADVEQAPLVQYPYVMLKVRREKLAKVAVTVWQSGSKPDGVAPFITTK